MQLPLIAFRLPFRAEGLSRLRQARRDGNVSVPSPDSLIGKAIELEQTIEEPDARGLAPVETRKITALADGIILGYEEYRSGKPALRREYENGLPAREWFAYHDPEGYWEGLALFSKTSAAPYYRKESLSIDSDGDGLREYKESYFPVLRKEWDYDADGRYDAAEESYPDRTLLFFSSKLDGKLDVRVELAKGTITSIRRQNKEFAVTRESGGELYWIGEKPFDLWKSQPEKDGIYEKSGKRYIFYRSGKIAFAEVVP
jgi:hypothetical protein